MRKPVFFILCTGLLVVSLFGCANNVEQTTLPEVSAQVEQTPSPTPTLKPTLKPARRPSLEEIENHFRLYDQMTLLKNEQLWETMHIQLVAWSNVMYAVIGDIEKSVRIGTGWGGFLDYEILDIDEDGLYEMVGYYDVGSGIIRSIPFVLKADGEYFAGRESEKIEQGLPNRDEFDGVIYYNLQIAKDGKSLLADARSALSGEGYSQVKIYYEDGIYIFELK